MFSCEFCKFFRTPFWQNSSGWLLMFRDYFTLACNFIKKEALAQVFSCEFSEISNNTFFTKYLWATASYHNLQDLSICLRISNKLNRINRWVNYFLIRLSISEDFFPVVHCSERSVSFVWWGGHFNNIILAMQNFIFLKIILMFQSFNRRDEKIEWTYIFPYRYDLYKENIFLNDTDVWRFDLFIEEKKKYNNKCFAISS